VPVDDALEDVGDAAKTLAGGKGGAIATDRSHRRLFGRKRLFAAGIDPELARRWSVL